MHTRPPRDYAGAGADLVDDLADDPAQLETMTEGDIAATLELAFGVTADFRGRHWELPEVSARRIAKYVKRSIDRHGGVPVWMQQWWPDIIAALLLGLEVAKRVGMDRQQAAERATAARGENRTWAANGPERKKPEVDDAAA